MRVLAAAIVAALLAAAGLTWWQVRHDAGTVDVPYPASSEARP